jgi:holo-[acyl-carrier protein] synthase
MIVGLGTDVCRIDRVGEYLERYGDRFKRRCFTPGEIAYCDRYAVPAAQYAARLAAKEAASKALGTGFRQGVAWKHFEVAREPSGKPTLRIHGRAAELASKIGVSNAVISLSHDGGVALAVVIFEGE